MRRELAIGRALREKRGQTLVEFAAVSIIVLLVIFGVMETGRLMLDYVTLADAARAGVRFAIVHGVNVNPPVTDADIQSVVQDIAGAAGVTLTTPATVSYGVNGKAPGSTVTVSVSYTFAPVTPMVSALGFTISSTSQGTICF